jgi:hypothetical protein
MIATPLIVAILVQPPAGQEPVRVTPGAEPETKKIYRALQEGEQRVEALLRRIECPPGRPVTFVLQLTDGKPVKYSAPSLTSVDFIAHTPDFRGPVSCGGKTPPERIYLTWKTVSRTDRVVAVEFLPGKREK